MAVRTPSTSPPPAPPTEECPPSLCPFYNFQKLNPHFRFMYPGFDRDDIYIMVEDEFYAVAKTFTQHLHHAEYVRLKSLAKERVAASTSATSYTNTITRPIDSITKMRAETKKRKDAEVRDARTKSALQQLRNPAGVPRQKSSSSDSEGFLDVDDDGAHWKGTALQGLMSRGPQNQHTSLIGLQGVKSSTRAAAGYSKAQNHNRPANNPAIKTFDLAPKPPAKEERKRRLPETTEPSTDEGSDTDDLDAPVSRRPASKPAAEPPPSLSYRPPPRSTKPPSLTRTIHLPHPLPTKPSKLSPQSKSPPSRQPFLHQTEAARRRRMKARLAREQEELRNKGGVGGDVDEIPVFLV